MNTALATTKEGLQEQLNYLTDSYRMQPSLWTWNSIMQVKMALTTAK